MAIKKDVIITFHSTESNKRIENQENITIYVWRSAGGRDIDIARFNGIVKSNNLTIVLFEDRSNPTNKEQWVIKSEDGYYWTGSYGTHPMGGHRARVFLGKHYAKRYNSKAVAKRSAEKMKNNGVFKKYFIEPYKT